MGGFFCCSFRRRAISNRSPIYIYRPQDVEEQVPSSSSHDASSAHDVSSTVSPDRNLDTSTPDTYHAPPAPLPYDVDFAQSQTVAGSFGSSGIFGTLRNMDHKSKVGQGKEYLTTAEEFYEVKRMASSTTTDEEDVCPICLEEYELANPCIMTKCEHDFHLPCILEWMERSGTCPICVQIMMIDDMYT